MNINKFFQETKGVISLMLVLLLVPFYSVAAILVEVERYKSAVSGLDGAIDSSLMSILSEYDSFLQDRFGLLAIGQSESASAENGFTGQKSISSTFERYLKQQDTTDSRSFSLSKTEAQGVYPLADLDILKAEIMEYGNMTVPSMMVADLGSGGLQEIISSFQKSVPFMGTLDVAGDAANIAGKEIDIQSKYKDVKSKIKQLNEKTEKYDNAHKELDEALGELKKIVKNVPSSDAPIEELNEFEEKYQSALQKAQDAKKNYQSALQTEIKSTEGLNSDLKTIAEKRNSVKDDYQKIKNDLVSTGIDAATTKTGVDDKGHKTIDNLNEQIKQAQKLNDGTHSQILDQAIKEELKDLKDEKAELDNIRKAADAAAKGTDSSQANKIMQDYNTESCSNAVAGLTEEMEQLKKLELDKVTPDNIEEITKIQETLHQTDMSKLSDFDNFSSLLKESEDVMNGANSSVSTWSSLAEIANELMSLSVTYDPKLQSVIDTQYYKENFGGLPSEKDKNRQRYPLDSKYESDDSKIAEQNLRQIDMALSALEQIGQWEDGIVTTDEIGAGGDEKASTKLGQLVKSMKSIMEMTRQSMTLLSNLQNLGSTTGKKLILANYLNYCTSNRVNYASAKSLTGAGIKNSGGLAKEVANSENNLAAWIQANEEVNYSLCGAETEYLLIGSNSEKRNQKVVFGMIYALRLAANAKPIKMNAEAQLLCTGLSGALSVVMPYPFAKAMAEGFLIALESYADAVLICNGAKDIPIIKAAKDVFCCGSGIPKLMGKLQNLSISESQKKKLQEKATDFEAGIALEGAVKSDGKSMEGFDFDQLKEAEKKSSGTSVCLDYQKYLLILLTIWSEKALLRRFADIVQMEETQRNLVSNASMSQNVSGNYPQFDLDKAYTALRAEVKGNFVSVLPVPNISKKSIWKTNRIIYRGY